MSEDREKNVSALATRERGLLDPNRIKPAHVLHSWKEIAGYVGRGVRTIQRWECALGMPIHRPRAKARSAVMAFSDEIDQWLRSAPTQERFSATKRHSEGVALDGEPSTVELVERATKAIVQHKAMIQRLDDLLRQLEFTRRSITALRTSERETRPTRDESSPRRRSVRAGHKRGTGAVVESQLTSQ